MFYSESFTSKNGPLAKVWLAAHVERKLSKSQFINASIPNSVEIIINDQQNPMSIRLKAQLLVGIAKIYSRKAKYLVDDCNDAIVKLKRSFNPAQVEMTRDQNGRHTITLQAPRNMDIGGFDDLEALDDTSNDNNTRKGGGNRITTAAPSDITLPMNAIFDLNLNADETFDINYDLGTEGMDQPVNDLDLGLEFDFDQDENEQQQQDKNNDDLAQSTSTPSKRTANEDNDNNDNNKKASSGNTGSAKKRRFEDMSMEVGRDHDASALADDFNVFNQAPNFGIDDSMDIDTGGAADPRNAFAQGPHQMSPTPEAGNLSFAKDAQLDQQQQDQQEDNGNQQEQGDADNNGDATATVSKPVTKKPRIQKQIIDNITELDETSAIPSRSSISGNASSQEDRLAKGIIVKSNDFLPNNKLQMNLLSLHEQAANFLANQLNPKDKTINVGPIGLCSSLSDLYNIPSRAERRLARKQKQIANGTEQQQEEEAGDHFDFDQSVELGRRESSVANLSILNNQDNDFNPFNGPQDFDDLAGDGDPSGPLDPANAFDTSGFEKNKDGENRQQLELDDDDQLETPRKKARTSLSPKKNSSLLRKTTSSQLNALGSQTSTPIKLSGEGCKISEFDDISGRDGVISSDQSPSQRRQEQQQSQSLSQQEKSQVSLSQLDGTSSLGSKVGPSTVKALRVLRDEFDDTDLDTRSPEKQVSFSQVSEKASKRAAASFFYELLFLGSRGCVDLDQASMQDDNDELGDITISSKSGLQDAMATFL